MYDTAKKGKAVKTLTPQFYKFESEGDQIIGVFISKAHVDSSLGGKGYNQYIFETDEGIIKFGLGQAADTEVAEIFTPGMVYAIEFLEKADISGGRSVNKYNIEKIGVAEIIEPESVKPEKGGTKVDAK